MAFSQSDALSVLARAPAQPVKDLAEAALARMGSIEVLVNRTGLVMLPFTDNAQGVVFHLGEVLVAEAHIRLPDGTEGYGMCLGRDNVLALAVSVLDAALTAHILPDEIAAFLEEHAVAQAAEDEALLKAVESTRIEMTTF